MSAPSPLKLLGRVLGAIHLVAAAVALLFLGVALFQAARFGFQAPPERYGRILFPKVAGTEAIVQSILGEARQSNYPPERIRVTVLGLAEEPGGEVGPDTLGIHIARALREAGIQVAVHDPRKLAAASPFLPAGARPIQDPLAVKTNILILACEEPEYADLDPDALSATLLRPKTVFDCRSLLDGRRLAAAGIQYVDMGNPRYDLWQDPDLQTWLDRMRLRIEDEQSRGRIEAGSARILFLPAHLLDADRPRPVTDSPRSRYFLALNYELLPHQLYFFEPVLASGTVAQYQAWVRMVSEHPPLSEDERRRSIIDTGADFLVSFLLDQDFRAEDYAIGVVGVRHGRPQGAGAPGGDAGGEPRATGAGEGGR